MICHKVIATKPEIYSYAIGETLLDITSPTMIIPLNYEFSIYIVESDYIARPDLISVKLYGSAKYTDILCKLNGISNPFELNEGQIMICPSDSYLDKFYCTIKSSNDKYDDSKSNQNTNTPQTKTTTDTNRSANDAVTGDSRFNIDKKNRVVVY